MLCSHTESICFRAHATMIAQVMEDIPLHLVAGSGWPVLHLLGHVSRVVRRHRFQLDFHPQELLEATQTSSASTSMLDLAECLPALRAAAKQTASKLGGPELVFATMAHGARFSPYVARFIARARALGIGDSLVVFCLDDGAYSECKAVKGHCVRGSPSILNKFTLPLVLLRRGLGVMWLDLDVFLFRSPLPAVVRQLSKGSYDLLVSGSFAVDCICSGIVVFLATERTTHWLEHLLAWMYEHPYEHDQKAFSAFLRAGERVAFDHELTVPVELVPAWSFLDPETEFVSARHVDMAGWTGDPDNIVAFHMLHGDSDDTHASRQFAARNGLGVGYTPLLDLFFNQTELPELYTTPVLPHRISEELREALMRSRWPSPRPTSPGRCNETVPMRF
ncbi:unnamed protein product [Polarella glacialis]|uniref:Nucleotide-diphospho-sugar transferase domain-containing protein n=1 Tax=Polarella glacialis TaxID=89957 RepID=A0A813IU70_POLGL|nr:unnamed protein product [Polarella glacialis]